MTAPTTEPVSDERLAELAGMEAALVSLDTHAKLLAAAHPELRNRVLPPDIRQLAMDAENAFRELQRRRSAPEPSDGAIYAAGSREVPADTRAWIEREGRQIGLSPEPCGWQPIETAPKDGTHILAWFDDFGGFPRAMTVRWIGPLNDGRSWWSIPGTGGLSPSHWMPLPNPPTKGDGA